MKRRSLSHRASGFFSVRRAATLVELLIFLALLAIVAAIALPILFSATEDRLLQETIAVVEQNGAQILRSMELQIHGSERILDPALGASGSVLTLQTASGSTDPTVFGVSSGALVMAQHAVQQTLSSPQVAVTNFSVRNTSITSGRQSVFVSFKLSRTIRLQAPRSYGRTFEALFTLFPVDALQGNACACAAPGCDTVNHNYVWQICEEGSCLTAQAPMDCH